MGFGIDQLSERQIPAAGQVAGSKPRAGFRLLAAEPFRRAGIDDLGARVAERLLHVVEVADQRRSTDRLKMTPRGRFGTGTGRQAQRLPARQAAIQDPHMIVVEDAECPPGASRGHELVVVVDDDRGEFLDAEIARGLRELSFRGQHVRQVGGVVGNDVDVEELRARDVGVQMLVPGIPALTGQEEGGVQDHQIGRIQSLRQPFGGYQRGILGCGHGRCSCFRLGLPAG